MTPVKWRVRQAAASAPRCAIGLLLGGWNRLQLLFEEGSAFGNSLAQFGQRIVERLGHRGIVLRQGRKNASRQFADPSLNGVRLEGCAGWLVETIEILLLAGWSAEHGFGDEAFPIWNERVIGLAK